MNALNLIDTMVMVELEAIDLNDEFEGFVNQVVENLKEFHNIEVDENTQLTAKVVKAITEVIEHAKEELEIMIAEFEEN